MSELHPCARPTLLRPAARVTTATAGTYVPTVAAQAAASAPFNLGFAHRVSRPAPKENEPVDLFGHGSERIDPVGVCLQRVHAGAKLFVGQPREKRVAAQRRFLDKAGPVGSDRLPDHLIRDASKPEALEGGRDFGSGGKLGKSITCRLFAD